MAGVAYAIQEKKKFFDSSLSFDVALLNDSEKSLTADNFPDHNPDKNFQGEANVDWQKMVALSNEISGKILSWDDTNNNLNIIAKNIIEQVDAFISNDSSQNIFVDINPDSDTNENLLQPNIENANFTENNASSPDEDILVEFDNFFLNAAKSMLAQNIPETGDIVENDSSANAKEKKQDKNDNDDNSNSNEIPEINANAENPESINEIMPAEVAVSGNGLMAGFIFFAAALGGGGGGGGSSSSILGGSSSSSSSSSGSVADGYVEDAFVFFDIDGDQEYDVGESFAYTDENGFYEIDNTPTGTYTIVAQGGIDVDSGEVIDVLYAPSDATMVTPLTTLSHFDPNFTIEGYENIDILNYDPIATLDANASSEEAATILSLGQQVMAVLGSVAEMSSTITGGDYESAFAEAAESLVDSSYGVSFDEVVNMGDADASDLSANLGTLVTGSLNAAYSEAGITDTSSISTIADAVGSGLSESLVKMDAQAVFNGESGALASITQGDMRRDIAELTAAAKSGEDLTSLANELTTTYSANAIDSLIVNKVSELSHWNAQKAAAKAAGLNISGDTFKTSGVSLDDLSSAIVDVIANDSLSGSSLKPEIVSVRADSDVFEEIRLDLTGIQGEIAITVGSTALTATYDPAIGLSNLLAELRDQANGLDYSFFSGGGNTQLLMRSDISGDRSESISVSIDGVAVIPDIKYSYSTPNVGDSFKIAYDDGGTLVVEQTSQLSDLDDYDLISAEIESLLPSGHLVAYDGSNISVTRSDGTSNFDIRWMKSVSSDGGEKLLKASQLLTHTDGTNNSLYTSSITDDGKVSVSAEYKDDEGNTDYALNTTGRFIYTVINPNTPDTFAEGLLSVTFNPVSPIVAYNGNSTGIQQLNFDEDTTFELNVKFENVGVFGSVFFKDLSNDFKVFYSANSVEKEAAYTFSESTGHLHSITNNDVLLLDQNDQGEVTFKITPKDNLSGDISAFTLIRSEVFGNTSAKGQLSFEMDINPVADGLEETTLSDGSLIEALSLDGSQSDALNAQVKEDQVFHLDSVAVKNFVDNLQSRMIDKDGSELIAIQVDIPDGLNVTLPGGSKLVITSTGTPGSFDIRLGVSVEQQAYFQTFIEEFSNVEFSADKDLSGTFTIGLTPKTFENGDVNQIKSAAITNFDIFVAPTADAPIIAGLSANTPNNGGDGTIVTTISGNVSSADTDGSEEVFLAISKDDILSISSFAYADFGDLTPLEFSDDNGETWYRISPPDNGAFNFEVIAPDTVASPFSVRIASLSRDIAQKADGTDYYTDYVFGSEQSARLNYIEYAKLPDFNFLNVADAFTEDQPIQLDQIIEIVPVPGKSLDSVRLTLDLPSGFSISGPAGMVAQSGSTFNVTFGRSGQDPYTLADFAIQTTPHFKDDFSLTINVTDEIPGNSISSDTPLTREFSVDPTPSGVSGAEQISPFFDLPIGAWTNIKSELAKVQPIDATESILLTLVVAGEGNFQVRVTNAEGVTTHIISEFDEDINESSFSLTQEDLDSSSIEILPKSTLISGGINTVPLRLEIQSVDGGLSEPVITEVVMNLSDQPLAPDASVSDAQTLEDVPIDLPFAAEVPPDRQGFERVGFELISVPDDFVGGKFTYKVIGDDVTVHEVIAQNGAVVLGIPGDNDSFAPIDFATLQFTGPENVSGQGTFQVQVFSEVFGQRTNAPQVDEFSLEIIPQAEVITFDTITIPNGSEDVPYDLGNLLIGSQTPLLKFETGSSIDPSETTLLKLTLPTGFELSAGSIVKSDSSTITYRVNANDWDTLSLISTNHFSGDVDLSMQITSIDDGDSYVSPVNDIKITIDATPDEPYPISLKNSVVSIAESAGGENIASIFGSPDNLLVDTEGEVLWINALALGSKTLEFSIDNGLNWSDDLSFAATDLENLLVRGFEAEAEKNDFSGEATAQFKTFSKENSQESTKSAAVDLKVIVQPQADGASTASIDAITPATISQQKDVLSLDSTSTTTIKEDTIVSSSPDIADGQVSIKLSDLIGANRAKADDLSEKVFYKIELSNEFNLANIGNAPALDAKAIDASGTIEYFVPAASLEKFSIVPNAHVSGDFTIAINVVTRESNGSLSSDQSLGSATLSITPVADAAILSVSSDLVSFSGEDNAINLPIIVAKRDISETLSLQFDITSKGSAVDSSKLKFTLDGNDVSLGSVDVSDLSRVKVHALDDFRGDNKVVISVKATTTDGSDTTDVIKPIEITFYKPLEEPTLRFAEDGDFDDGTIDNAGYLIEGSDQQIGSMLEIPVKGFVEGFDSANYDLSMLVSNVPEYASLWLLKADGSYLQVGTSLSEEGSYSGLWLLSENQLPGASDHLVMIYDELVLAGDDDGIVDISFNGNLMKFQALATDAEAGTSSVSAAKYLGEKDGQVDLYADTTNVNALQFNISNVTTETTYHAALKVYLKTAGLLDVADPVIVSFVDADSDFVADAPISAAVADGVTFELDSSLSGAEVPLSWVDNWYTDANGDSVIDLNEVHYAVLTKGSSVSQLSDLYLNIDDLATLDTDLDNYLSTEELSAGGTQLWVDADRDFTVDSGELLVLPEYFDIYLPGQPYEGTSSGDLSIIEYADAHVSDSSLSFNPSAAGIFGIGIPYTSSQAPSGPVSANAFLTSNANLQLTTVPEAQLEDISGGFPLAINFTASVLDPVAAPTGTMRSDWIKLTISDASGTSVDANGDPVFSVSNGIWVVDENNAANSYWIILEESIPTSQMLNISAPDNYKGAISINAQAMTSLAISNIADVTAQTQTATVQGGSQSLNLSIAPQADQPLFAVDESIYSVEINEGEALDLGQGYFLIDSFDDSESLYVDFIQYTGYGAEPSFTLNVSGQAVSLTQENQYESYYRVAKADLANLELNLTDNEYAGGIYFQVRGVSQDGIDEARTFSEYVYVPVIPVPDVPQGNVNGINIAPSSVIEGSEVVLDGLSVTTGDSDESVYFDIYIKKDGDTSVLESVEGSLYYVDEFIVDGNFVNPTASGPTVSQGKYDHYEAYAEIDGINYSVDPISLQLDEFYDGEVEIYVVANSIEPLIYNGTPEKFEFNVVSFDVAPTAENPLVDVTVTEDLLTETTKTDPSLTNPNFSFVTSSGDPDETVSLSLDASSFNSLLTIAVDSDNDTTADYYLVGDAAGGWNKITDAQLNVLTSGTFTSDSDALNAGESIKVSVTIDSTATQIDLGDGSDNPAALIAAINSAALGLSAEYKNDAMVVSATSVGVSFTIDIVKGADDAALDSAVTWTQSTVDTQITESFANSFTSTQLATTNFSVEMVDPSTNSTLAEEFSLAWGAISNDDGVTASASGVLNFGVEKQATTPNFTGTIEKLAINDGETTSLDIAGLISTDGIGAGEILEVEITGLPTWLTMSAGYIVDVESGVDIAAADRIYRIPIDELADLEVQALKRNLDGSETAEETSATLLISLVALEPGSGHVATSTPLDVDIKVSPVPMTPNITGPKTLSIDEGGVAEFFETINSVLTSKYNIFFGDKDSDSLKDTIRLRLKIEIDGANSESSDTPGITVTGASLNEDSESENYGYYVLSHIDDLKTLTVQFADEQRSGEINVSIEAYQDFTAGSEFSLPANPDDYREFTSTIAVNPDADSVAITGVDPAIPITLTEGGSLDLEAVTVTPVDSGENILIQIRVPESFTLTEKVWDTTLGEGGAFVVDDNNELVTHIVSPNKIVSGVARYTVDSELLALGAYSLEAAPYIDGPLTDVVVIRANSVEIDGSSGPLDKVKLSLDITSVADDLSLMTLPPLINGKEDNFFSFGVDAFAFDSDEILEVTFDLFYDADGDRTTTDVSLFEGFDFGGKSYQPFKIFDPDSVVDVEITLDPVTQGTYANGQAISFDVATKTISVENLGTFVSGMEVIINGRATTVKVESASEKSITLTDDPTQGSGLNEGDQILFASQLTNFTYKTEPSHWTVHEHDSVTLDLDVEVTSLAEGESQPTLKYKLLVGDRGPRESADGTWTLADIKADVAVMQTNDFYTDVAQVLSQPKVKIYDESDNHLATLTVDLLSGEVTKTRMIDDTITIESGFAFRDDTDAVTEGLAVEYYDGSVIDPSKEFLILPPADFVFDPTDTSSMYIKASAVTYDNTGDPTIAANYTTKYSGTKESSSNIIIKAATDGPNPIKQVADTIQLVEDQTEPNVVIFDSSTPENGLVSFADPLESRAIKLTFSDHEFALIIEKTIAVTVEQVNGQNKYLFDGVQESQLELVAGHKYIFDWSDVATHPLNFSTVADGEHSGGVAYIDGVVIDGDGKTTTIIATENTPTLYYYCEAHSGMGTGDVTIDTTGGRIENTDGSITYTVLNEIIQDNFNEKLDLSVKLIPAKDFNGTGHFNVTSSSKQGIDETKTKSKDFSLDVSPVSDAANVALNSISVDGYDAIIDGRSITITFDEDSRVGNPFALLNFNNLLTNDYAINVTQPIGGIDHHFLDEEVHLSLAIDGQVVNLTTGYNLLNLVSSRTPGELQTFENISSRYFLTPELEPSIQDTDFSVSNLTAEGAFDSKANIVVNLDEHPFVDHLNHHQQGGLASQQVHAQLIVLGTVVAQAQLTQDFQLGNILEFSYADVISGILGELEVDFDDLAATENEINGLLKSGLSLSIQSIDDTGAVTQSQLYEMSLDGGVNTITPDTGGESFLETSIAENASGSLNFTLNVASSDHGETPVESTYRVDIDVNRIADVTDVYGLFYENLSDRGVDVISLYQHPDQDGSESLTVDLYVDDEQTPITQSADVTSNHLVNTLTPTATTTLAATLTAREDVSGYGNVKKGFERSIDDSSTGTIIYVDDPNVTDYLGTDGNDLFASSFGTYNFDGGDGVDKIDLSLLALDDEADSLSVVLSVKDGFVSGGLSYSVTTSNLDQPVVLNDTTLVDGIEFKQVTTGGGGSISIVTGSVPTDAGSLTLTFSETEIFTATSGEDLILGYNYDENDIITLGENDVLNILDGGSGDDYILGGDRWEVIAGGDGDDYLEGGAGVDYFYWDGLGSDVVYDFVWGVDKLFVDASFTESPTASQADATVTFTSGGGSTLTLNIADAGIGLTDQSNFYTDKWLEEVYTTTDSGILGVYQDLLLTQNEAMYHLGVDSIGTTGSFEPQDGSDFVENYTQTHSYTSFEPAEDSDFIENYQQTHSYTSFEPQEGSDFVENYTQTHSYSLEGDIDSLAYELNLIETNEF